MSGSTFGRKSGKSRRDFLRDGIALGAVTFAAPTILIACGTSTSKSPSTSGIGKPTRKNTLYVGGFQWGPPTTFNPLAATGTWPATGNGAPNAMQHLYESLFAYNLLNGNLEPQVAKSLNWTSQATAVVTLRSGVHFSDGKPLTADDVVYTFELAKRHTEISYANFWNYADSVTKKDDHTIQFSLKTDSLNPGQLKSYLAGIYILPQHIYSGVESSASSLLTYVDMHPVGSGPYKVYDASQERVALIRDNNYWGKDQLGMPAPAYIIHPIFKSNDDANLAFQNAELDISQTFTPQIWQEWQDKKQPVGTWFKNAPYHVPGSIPMLWLNLHKAGLNNVKVRQAIAYSIDFPTIVETAMSRYSSTVKSSLIIPAGPEQKLFDSDNVTQYGWEFNAQKATQILDGMGAHKGSDGIYVLPDGTRLGPWQAQCPYGWTDWMTSLQVVSQSAKKVGIEINTYFPEAPQWSTAVQNGNFDIAMNGATGLSPASPWARFRDVLESRGLPPIGQTAFRNYGRFSDPAVGKLLDDAAAASGPQQASLLAQLDKVVMQNLPVIPLEYRPLEFYEYNATTWTGFPNSGHAVAPPMQGGAGIKILYGIKVKS
jgi:peptide/nickel transport system substrate-binding protein